MLFSIYQADCEQLFPGTETLNEIKIPLLGDNLEFKDYFTQENMNKENYTYDLIILKSMGNFILKKVLRKDLLI